MSRFSLTFISLGYCFLNCCFAAPAVARSEVNAWFCKVLNAPFDPVAAIKSFPLEVLPEPIESKETKTDGDGDTTTWISLESKGDTFQIEYRYAYRHDNVTSPYGFNIELFEPGAGEEGPKKMLGWLKELGKPTRDIIGYKIGAGPPIYEGGDQVFYFRASMNISTYEAHWWKRSDVVNSQALCK